MSNARLTTGFIALYGSPPDPAICPPPEAPPAIEDQYAVSADTTAATVRAAINPHFWPTTRYYVEYGTTRCSEGGCTETAPVPPGDLLTDKVASRDIATKGVLLDGLEPDTTYFYRFVATTRFEPGSEVEVEVRGVGGEPGSPGEEASFHTYAPQPPQKSDCPNQAFRSGPSAFLPDCRAYEMVSPPDKNDGDVLSWQEGFNLISTDGDRATFSSYRGFADPGGVPQTSQYLAERTAGGWVTESISAPRNSLTLYPPVGSDSKQLFKGFSEDLCSAGMVQDTTVPLAADAPPEVPNLYRRVDCGPCPVEEFAPAEGCYELLTPVPPPGFGYEPNASFYYPEYQGSSEDGARSVVRADAALTPDACTTKGIYQVYESIRGQGLTLISVLPSGAVPCSHSSAGTYQGLVNGHTEDSLHHAVSADGRRVYWTNSPSTGLPTPTARDAGSGNLPGSLFLRVNVGEAQSAIAAGKCTEAAKACTLRVSQLATGDPARFLTATPDGGEALFSTAKALYRFELGPSPKATEISKGLLGFVGASEDLSRVYLISSEDQTPGEANGEGEEAVAGEPNLYLYEEGAGFSFVAGLSSADISTIVIDSGERPTPMAHIPNRRTSRVSADGERLIFTSAAQPTGFDNRDAESGQADSELFLFDHEIGGGELACVSCNPSGVRPRGRLIAADEKVQYWSVARIPGWAQALRPTSPLSDSGQVFFESFEPLVLRDTNQAADVYTWQRAGGRAGCLEAIGGEVFIPAEGGCLSLISAGKGSVDSFFLDATPEGTDVLIATDVGLLAPDPGLTDVYDARIGGGFPPQPPPDPGCEGAACQAPAPAPGATTPASSEFHGAGNVAAGAKKKCGKGRRKVKRRGKVRCVKVKRHRRAGRDGGGAR